MRALTVTRRRLGIAAAVVVLVLATLATAVTVLAVRVSGVSMEPTLGDGERVLLRPFSGGDVPARFAVVVARFGDRGPAVVKRVIGLPGDRIRISGTTVTVQPGGTGAWLVVENPAWTGRWGPAPVRCCRPTGQAGERSDVQTVPPGQVFLLGDDPGRSEDSRAFGWAPVPLIEGVARWRVRAWFLPASMPSKVRLRAIS